MARRQRLADLVELLARVEALAGGLAGLGVSRGDTVAIMLGNRPEFPIVDLAVVMLGATPFSIYTTYPPEEIRYLIEDSGAGVTIVEQAFLPVMLEARKELPGLEHVIVVDGDAPEGTVALAEVEGSNPEFDAAAVPGAQPGDVLTLIYTSGTTGPPKGVQLSHHNIMFAAKVTEEIINLEPGAKVISWLPAAHIAERMAHHYLPTIFGGTVTCCPNPREILTYLPQVHPTWFFAVPRIWEKLKAGLETMLAGQPEEQRVPLEDAIAASTERVRLRQRGEPVPAELEAKVAEADEKSSPGFARCSASTRSRASTSARRRRPWRYSSSSTRSGSSWPSCGGCRRRAVPGPATVRARSRSGPSDLRHPGAKSGSPTTARCSSSPSS